MTHDQQDELEPPGAWLPRLTLQQLAAIDDPQLKPHLAVLRARIAQPLNTLGGSSGS